MNVTNNELAEFRARRRGHSFQFPPPREPSWMQPRDERGTFKLVLSCILAGLIVILALGFATRTADDIKHEQWAKSAVDACVVDGKTPHVYRDKREYILGVRCE